MAALAQVRELFDRALTVPEGERHAFLSGACSDDVDLRLTVERLLQAESKWSVFDTASSAALESGDAPVAGLPRLEVGTRLGPYEIVASIDRGGMGEVYQAVDRRLDRQVAVKVLRRTMSDDARAQARFIREAHTIAALSHPNICHLFDVGQADGTDYLVMELLQGETLAARLRRGRLTVAEAIPCALQIVEGLAAAHRAGIVHRDLKPANIMLTPTGARLLDFGLARTRLPQLSLGDSQGESGTLPEGTPFVGTLPYMAPEQLEGAVADEQTDVFAFGVVLFEMLTGRRAFGGDSGAAVIAQMLTASVPPLASSGVKVPAWLDRIATRCVAPSRDARFRSIHDVQAAIVAAHRPRFRWLPLVAALVVLLASGVAALTLWPSETGAPHVTAMRRLTYDRTPKDFPYTDGTRLFYVEWKPAFAGTSLLQLPVAGGDPRPVRTPFTSPYLFDVTPAGDSLIADTVARRLHLMSASGEARAIGNLEARFADLSSDGLMLAFSSGPRLMIARRDGSGIRHVLEADGNIIMPRWSPDGSRLRYTVDKLGAHSLWDVSTDGSGARVLLPGWQAACGAWTPDGRYFVFEAERNGAYGLWALDERRRWWKGNAAPFPLTTGPMRYENAVPSPNGSTVFALGTPPGGVELVRFDARTKQFAPALAGLAASEVEFSADGAWIAYVRHADSTLWRSRADGTERLQLTFTPQRVIVPRWSPDGRQIAFAAHDPQGPLYAYIVGVDGGRLRRVSAGTQSDEDPSWAPDGTRVVLTDRTKPSQSRLHIVDIASGRVEAVPGSEGLFSPRWSPDGRLIAALSNDDNRLAVYDLTTQRWRELLRGPVGWPSWTRDGTHIQLQSGSHVVRVRVLDGQVERVADLGLVKQAIWGESGGVWVGHMPDEAPLVLREVGTGTDIYALQVEWP